MTWYYESGGQQQGPISDADLDNLLSQGKVTLDTLVWREGQAGWAPLRAARPPGGVPPGMPVPPPLAEDVDIGLEVTRPAVRSTSSSSAPGGGSDLPQPGYVRCTATGRYFPPSEIIYIEGKPYSAGAKPQVVASLQSGGALPVSSDSLNRNGPPWEQRDSLGMIKAIVETIKGVFLQPSATFASMKRDGGLGSPILFWALTAGVALAISQVYGIFFQGAMVGMMSGLGGMQGNPGAAVFAMNTGMQVAMIFIVPPLYLVFILIYAGLMHLCLKMLKGANQGYEATFRALAYASGAGLSLGIIPVCGGLVGMIWGLVSLCIGLGKVHDTSTEKGVGGTLLPLLLCCVLYVGFIVVVIGAAGAFGAASRR